MQDPETIDQDPKWANARATFTETLKERGIDTDFVLDPFMDADEGEQTITAISQNFKLPQLFSLSGNEFVPLDFPASGFKPFIEKT